LRGGPLPTGWTLGLVAAISAIAFLRLLERSDPLWRIPIWMHALTVAGLWHLLLHRLTGRSLHFLPVTILALTAVPLPPMIENALIRRLTELVLAYSVPVDRALGMPVEMAGTALTAQGRVLQIDDGCSGIRSFQSLLMISVFFGEFFRLAWWKRLVMVASGVAAAFLFNGLRTVTLTWIFFERGEARFHQFHDLVGMITFALSGIAVFWLASVLAGATMAHPAGSPPEDSHSQSEKAAA
jgi:exosortase